MIMNKKTYIQPSIQLHQLNLTDGILTVLSGGGALQNGGDTSTNNVTKSDTKAFGSWDDIW